MNIKDATKKMLETTGMTQAQLAQKAGVNRFALSKFLHKENGCSIAEKIAPIVYERLESARQKESESQITTSPAR